MIVKTEVWLKSNEKGEEEHLVDVDQHLPLERGDEFYYSVSEPYPNDIKKYHERLQNYPKSLREDYIKNIQKESDRHHIETFRVVSISKSLDKNYSQGINDESKLVEFVTTIYVEYIDKIYDN
jgi:hypothetical protein